MKAIISKLRTRKRTGKDTVDIFWLRTTAHTVGMSQADLTTELLRQDAITAVRGNTKFFRILIK